MQYSSTICFSNKSGSSTHTLVRSTYHYLVDPLAHHCPKIYGYILTSGNLRTNASACIASPRMLRMPKTWNSFSAEIVSFLQSPDPLPWKMLR